MLANVDFSKPYGTHTRPFYICKYLHHMRNAILVLCSQGNQDPGLPQFVNLKSMRFRTQFRYLVMIEEIIHYIKLFNPNILYSHGSMFTIVAYLSKRMSFSKIPIVLDKHGSWAVEQTDSFIYPILKSVESLAIKCADKVIAASEDLKQSLMRIYKIPSKKLAIVPNGVDPEVFHLLPKNKLSILTKRLGEDKKIIVFPAPRNFISNIIAIKFMYNVMGQLSNKDPRIILLITGGGCVIEPKPANVIYTGFVEDLNEYLNSADVAVAPYPKEARCGGARNKVLEYFACKILVVSTKEGIRGIDGALPDIHFIFAKDDTTDFAKKILTALNMSEKEKLGMIEKSYSITSTEYSWENQARKVSRIFNSLAQEINKVI